jgi:hypothetical protein
MDVLLEHMRDPPNKSRGITKVLGYSILINFNRVAILDICQKLPTCCPIFSFNTQVPTLGCLPDLLFTSMFDIHISVFHSTTIILVINNSFHQVELVVSSSHCAYTLYVMMFALYSSLRPS